MTSDMFGDLD